MIRLPKYLFLVFLCLILFVILPGTADGQGLKKFTGDSTKYIGELNTLFLTLSDNDQKTVAKLMTGFIQQWNSEQFNPSQKKDIYFISNQMLEKRLKALLVEVERAIQKLDAGTYGYCDMCNLHITTKSKA